MKEIPRINRIDVAVGATTGITYSLIAPTNEVALVLAPAISIATPFIGKAVYMIYSLLRETQVDRGSDGYYGLKSEHARSGISQIDIIEEDGYLTPDEAERLRQIYAKRHSGH